MQYHAGLEGIARLIGKDAVDGIKKVAKPGRVGFLGAPVCPPHAPLPFSSQLSTSREFQKRVFSLCFLSLYIRREMPDLDVVVKFS